jgi:tetratricopeptide (TPR) repeat protein
LSETIRADFGKLLTKFEQEAPEERNQSLLASLEFSRRHLSPAAREALPWLGLFNGGVFENVLLPVSQLAREAWEPIRRELQGTALLGVQGTLEPFLRFHPTLASVAADPSLAKSSEIRQRFVSVYSGLMEALDRALSGAKPRAAMEMLNREEANCRTAIQWAVADQQLQIAAALGGTFQDYLERSGRLRERDAWVQWLKDAVSKAGFTEGAAIFEREHAWTHFTQGDPQGAVDQLQKLIERLRHTVEFDPAFQLAAATLALGRMMEEIGASAQAIPILRDAVVHWEALVEKVGGRPWEALLASSDEAKTASQLGNLSAAMGDLANALGSAGQHDEALAVAENALRISERRGNLHAIATGQVQIASVLMAAGRYVEADDRYDLAFAAARRSGDKGLEATLLQHQGSFAEEGDELERASRLYQQALQLFREAGDLKGVEQIYNLLGVVEDEAGRLAEARAWYEKSRELAAQLGDQVGLGQATQNVGIIWQKEGEAARERGDEPTARRHFEEARISVEQSLQIHQARGNKPDEAGSWGQLARIYLRLGNLAAAERHAQEARQIHESLGLKEALLSYRTLIEIAYARGDLDVATEWSRKRDDFMEELERRMWGSDDLPA